MTFVQKLTKCLDDYLKREDNAVSVALARIEALSGVQRLHLAVSMLALFVGYMVFGFFAPLLCNLIGFIYPAYLSIVALDQPPTEESRAQIHQLLRYWVLFAFMSVGDFFVGTIFRFIPFYWLFKALFLVWCLIPVADNGANVVYFRFIQPVFRQVQPLIDSAVDRFYAPFRDHKQ